jgi:hypothetical protein
MSNFIKNNFEAFQASFEKHIGRKLCPWIEDNIVVKKTKKHKKVEKAPKWFLCHVLLREPSVEVTQFCEEHFSEANNLNGRTPHEYACDQVFGYLKEVYHIKRLELKHPNIELTLVSDEFNKDTGKREIYTEGSRSGGIDLKARFKENKDKTKYKGIHIKSNSTFIRSPTMTFRGGRNPEINKIKNIEHGVHIPVDENQYFSISDLLKNKDCIESEGKLTNPEDMKSWGGEGSYRIKFTKNILKFATPYQWKN